MFSNLKRVFFFLVMIITLSGCGDLVNKEVVKKGLDGSQFSVQCEMDMDSFSQIMEENISSQIRCLGENLNLFIKIVKSDKFGYLSRFQLEKYLATHRPDVKPEAVKGLKSIFDLGHLITGEDPNYISKETIDKVINFAIIFNREAALNFAPIFKNESPVTYALHQNHRDRVSSANKAIIQALRTIFKPNRKGEVHKLNIISLLESFTNEENRDSIETAKKVLFLKKILLGGDNEIITHQELEKLIFNFDQLLLIGLDIIRYKYIILKQDSLLQLLKRDVNDLYDIVHQGNLNNRDEDILFTLNEAVDAAKLFIEKETFDLDKFRNIIAEAKKIFLKGNATEVKGSELKNLFTHAKSLLKTGTVFHRIYDKFRVQLENPKPVEETINFDEYRHTYPEHQSELNQFERITKKYRFMKGEFLSSYYTTGSRRNADAIFEIAMLEYAVKELFATFGTKSPNADAVGGYSINQDLMRKLLRKFETELIELNLILPGRVTNTADNISLLGTLFQYQSDNNKFMDVNEGTEFAVSLIGALNISQDLFIYMKDQNCSIDEFDRVDPACFKNHFWKGLCSYYKNYFPLMFQSLNAPKKCEDFVNTPETKIFLDKSISAARTCNYYSNGQREEIPYSEGDLMTIMLALMHAETTILRWDLNNTNIMESTEVDKAYDIYSPALDGFMENMSPVIKKFKKQIYKFLIKHERVPDPKDFGSIWKFVKFLASFNKDVPANRKTIVSVLYEVGEQNKKAPGSPIFDCNLLRDPENIPSEFENMPPDEDFPSAPVSDSEIINSLRSIKEVVNSLYPESQLDLNLEIRSFSDDMEKKLVTRISEVRQKNLKRVFEVISRDQHQVKDIHRLVDQGSELEKIGFAVSLAMTTPL